MRLRRERSAERLTPKGNVTRDGFGSAFWRIVCHAAGSMKGLMADWKGTKVVTLLHRWEGNGCV